MSDIRDQDPIVEAVREDLRRRSEAGMLKYGVGVARTDLTLQQWLQHAYEEVLDTANYLKRVIVSLEGDQAMLSQQVQNWIEGMQPTDLQNRTTAELQDELQRRQREDESRRSRELATAADHFIETCIERDPNKCWSCGTPLHPGHYCGPSIKP